MRDGVRRGLGMVALVLIGVLLLHAAAQKPPQATVQPEQKDGWKIRWETDVVVYDGTGKLDLMEGVTITDQEGTEHTAEASAVLKNTQQPNQKQISYTVQGAPHPLSDEVRLLILENYTGPVLQVAGELHLTETQLQNLPAELAQQGNLVAENGYGVDLSGQVSWYREKLGDGEYRLTFTVINEFYDVASVQSRAYISGVTDDIVLSLRESEISLAEGESFLPNMWILTAQDAAGKDLSQKVEVDGTVNTSQPGTYTVRYSLVSEDAMQRAEQTLRVTVREERP